MFRDRNKQLILAVILSVLFHLSFFLIRSKPESPDRDAQIKLKQGRSSVQIQLLPQKKITAEKEKAVEPKEEEKLKEEEIIEEKVIPVIEEKIVPILEEKPLPTPVPDSLKTESIPVKAEEIIEEIKEKTEEIEVVEKTMEENIQAVEERITPDENMQDQPEQEEIPEFISDGSQGSASIIGTFSPEYPRLARKRGYEGIVTLQFTVLQNGKVRDIQILHSSGHKSLDQAAVKEINNAEFQPAMKNNKAIDSTMTLEIDYNLNQ